MRLKRLLTLTVLATLTISANIGATTLEQVSTGTTITSEIEEKITNEAVDGVISRTTATETKLRKAPDGNADIITLLEADTTVVVKQRVDNFYLVSIGDLSGYIYKTQIDESNLSNVPYIRSQENTIKETKYLGEEVVEYAKKFLGNPYVYGGNSLTKGVDCSGFTSQIYKHFGYNLQRSSKAQYASNGYKVSKSEIKPGDLVFYGNNGVVNHVAIYAGNNQIIHANDAKTGIKMSKLEYGKPIIGIKRIIK